MIVMKFGGTSVANSETISRVISIVRDKLSEKPIVVVSALSGITGLLYKITDAVRHEDEKEASEYISEIWRRHLDIVNTLVTQPVLHEKAMKTVSDICQQLSKMVDAICTIGELTDRTKARIISAGAWLSSNVIYYVMNSQGISTGFADAHQMIITTGSIMKGRPVLSEIKRRTPSVIDAAFQGHEAVITQGFIASNEHGDPAILGPGGSDYTATLIGVALDVKSIEIWTCGDGVRTADPRRVTETHSIDRISFEEAAQLAHFGDKTLHPLTIEHAVAKNIPVYLLNTMNPQGKGTAILCDEFIEEGVKLVSYKEKIVMLSISSPSMIQVSGFLSKVFAIFADNDVSVDLISTSEANISLTIEAGQDLSKTIDQLSEFAVVKKYDDKSQISIIGKNAVNQRGLIRWAMTSLYNTKIYMVSQDASFVNMSFVIDHEELDETLLDLHRYLFEF